MLLERHLKGMAVGRRYLQGAYIALDGLIIACHHLQNRGVGRGHLRRHKALPTVDKVLCRHCHAVRPENIVAEGEGIGLRAVLVGNHRILGSLSVYQTCGRVFHQILKQMLRDGALLLGGGIDGV